MISLIPSRLVLELVRRRIDDGKPEDAVHLARRYTELCWRNPKAWAVLDYAFSQGHVPLAQQEAEFRLGLERTQHSSVGLLLARVLFLEEKASEGEALLEQLATSHPNDPDVRANLASVSISRGDFDSATKLIEEALALTTQKTAPEVLVGIYVNLVPLGQKPRAIELLESLVTRWPNNAGPYVILSQLLEKEFPERAKVLLRQAKEIWGRRPGFSEWDESVRIPQRFLDE